MKKTPESTFKKGRYAEERAGVYLSEKGYQILHKNYRTKVGEIDIIVLKQQTLVFVEVKRSYSKEALILEERVDRRKQGRIIAAARLFLQEKIEFQAYLVRFDVIGFFLDADIENINHIENAFWE